MKKLLLIVSFFSASSLSAQRIIDNRLTVFVTYETNSTTGQERVDRGNYSSISLVNNFTKGHSLGIDCSYKFKNFLSADLRVMRSTFNDWNGVGQTRFQDARYSIMSFSPLIRINTPFQQRGIFNRLAFFVRLGPSFSSQNAELERSPYTPDNTVDFDFQNSRSFNIGISGSAGMRVSLSNRVVAGLSYGVDQYWISSVLHDDETCRFTSVGLQLGFRFFKNKWYKYSS